MDSRIVQLDPNEGYDSSGLDMGFIYYSAEYSSFLSMLLDAKNRHLISGPAHNPFAMFPLLEKAGPHGMVLNSLPFFGSHGGPVTRGESPIVASVMLQHLDQMISSKQWDAVTVIEHPLQPWVTEDLANLTNLKIADTRVSQITEWKRDPPDSLEELLVQFHGKMRNAIRKGMATGQVVSQANSEAEWQFLEYQHANAIRRLGGVEKNHSVFDCLRHHLGKRVRLHCGYVDSSLCSALLTLRYGSTTEYFVPVVSPEMREQQVLPHLIAQVMLTDFQNGISSWNWGGTWESQSGVLRFKSRFGATNRKYRYLNWCTPRIRETSQDRILRSYPYWYLRKFE